MDTENYETSGGLCQTAVENLLLFLLGVRLLLLGYQYLDTTYIGIPDDSAATFPSLEINQK